VTLVYHRVTRTNGCSVRAANRNATHSLCPYLFPFYYFPSILFPVFLSFFLSFSFLSFSSFLSFIFLLNLNIDFCGSGWCSRYSDLLWTGRSGDRIPVVVRFSAPRPHQARGPPSPLYNGYRVSLPAAKAADAWRSTHPM